MYRYINTLYTTEEIIEEAIAKNVRHIEFSPIIFSGLKKLTEKRM